jgi:hypothetical protein
MGWTGRAPAPDGTQSAPGACQEKERRHASHVQRSRSDYYRNGYGQEHTSHDWPRFAGRHRVAREGLTRTHRIGDVTSHFRNRGRSGVKIGPDEITPLLGVELRGNPGRTHQVAEQHREIAALPAPHQHGD